MLLLKDDGQFRFPKLFVHNIRYSIWEIFINLYFIAPTFKLNTKHYRVHFFQSCLKQYICAFELYAGDCIWSLITEIGIIKLMFNNLDLSETLVLFYSPLSLLQKEIGLGDCHILYLFAIHPFKI
jgi:hypothetical protein